MKLKNLKRLTQKIKLRTYTRDSWIYHATLLNLGYPDNISLTKNRITLANLELDIDYNNFLFLLIGYKNATALIELAGAKFTIIDNKMMISLDQLTFEVQTAEELFILKEIFVEGVYNFKTTRSADEYVLIDIGMNVAYASCYFSKVKKIPEIISFEPFTPTYIQAQSNITLNGLGDSIDARNIGLGGKTEKIEVNYSPDYRGQVGLNGTDLIRSTVINSQKEEILILDALPELTEIEKEFSSKRFIFKIDCEGAEYDLFPRIPTGILERTDIIMMEWHEKGPTDIESWLKKSGYSVMSFYPLSKRAGMIYAIRN